MILQLQPEAVLAALAGFHDQHAYWLPHRSHNAEPLKGRCEPFNPRQPSGQAPGGLARKLQRGV